MAKVGKVCGCLLPICIFQNQKITNANFGSRFCTAFDGVNRPLD